MEGHRLIRGQEHGLVLGQVSLGWYRSSLQRKGGRRQIREAEIPSGVGRPCLAGLDAVHDRHRGPDHWAVITDDSANERKHACAG